MNKPVIGISSSYDYEKNNLYLKAEYYKAIDKAGGSPVIIPPVEDSEVLLSLIDKIDGLLLVGGPDVNAKRYGENNLPFNGGISPERDIAEIYMAKEVAMLKKPILGICRGVQVINVAFGGTLYQDIYAQIKDKQVLKHSQEAPQWYPTHDIIIEDNSRVKKWFGNNIAGVNTYHHQAVKDLAPGFKATARTEDGIIESIEFSGNNFLVGVQWHPEGMWRQSQENFNMFLDFIECCL